MHTSCSLISAMHTHHTHRTHSSPRSTHTSPWCEDSPASHISAMERDDAHISAKQYASSLRSRLQGRPWSHTSPRSGRTTHTSLRSGRTTHTSLRGRRTAHASPRSRRTTHASQRSRRTNYTKSSRVSVDFILIYFTSLDQRAAGRRHWNRARARSRDLDGK